MRRTKKNVYKNIYKITYIANVNRVIEESKYIDTLQQLSTNGFKTYHIDDFDKFVNHLLNVGLNDSFNITKLISMRDNNYKNIADMAVVFEDVGRIFSSKKKSMMSRVKKIQTLLKTKLHMMRSFRRVGSSASFRFPMKSEIDTKIVENVLSVNIDSPSTNTSINEPHPPMLKSYTKEKIEEEFKHYLRHDIVDRLHLLAQKHFTLEQLTFMNVQLKCITEIEEMSLTDLEFYYLEVVSTIISALQKYLGFCKRYYDIEINYAECCEAVLTGNPTKLNMS
jgi:hypothetical protein